MDAYCDTCALDGWMLKLSHRLWMPEEGGVFRAGEIFSNGCPMRLICKLLMVILLYLTCIEDSLDGLE